MRYDTVVAMYKGMGNTAKIERCVDRPSFRGDTVKADTYRVIFSADYDGNFIYHISCFDSVEDARNHIKEYPFFEYVGIG